MWFGSLQSSGALVVHSVKSSEEVEASQARCCFLLISQTYLGKLLKGQNMAIGKEL